MVMRLTSDVIASPDKSGLAIPILQHEAKASHYNSCILLFDPWLLLYPQAWRFSPGIYYWSDKSGKNHLKVLGKARDFFLFGD